MEDHVNPQGSRCHGRDVNWTSFESKSTGVPLRKPARRMPVGRRWAHKPYISVN